MSDLAEFLLDRVADERAQSDVIPGTFAEAFADLHLETWRLKIAIARDAHVKFFGRRFLRKWALPVRRPPGLPPRVVLFPCSPLHRETQRMTDKDPVGDLKRAIMAAIEPVVLPVLRWLSRRSYGQQMALLFAVSLVMWGFVQWSITHP